MHPLTSDIRVPATIPPLSCCIACTRRRRCACYPRSSWWCSRARPRLGASRAVRRLLGATRSPPFHHYLGCHVKSFSPTRLTRLLPRPPTPARLPPQGGVPGAHVLSSKEEPSLPLVPRRTGTTLDIMVSPSPGPPPPPPRLQPHAAAAHRAHPPLSRTTGEPPRWRGGGREYQRDVSLH